MELTKESLESKIKETQQEIVTFARSAQDEVNALQQALQVKVRESQKHVDNLEGKLASYQELLSQFAPNENPDNIVAMPKQPTSK